jgi:hypothetical protein
VGHDKTKNKVVTPRTRRFAPLRAVGDQRSRQKDNSSTEFFEECKNHAD